MGVVIQMMIIVPNEEIVAEIIMNKNEIIPIKILVEEVRYFSCMIAANYFDFYVGYGSEDGSNRGRNNNSGGGGGGDESQMETQRDTIFIQNLPKTVTSAELIEVFSQIGIIKVRYEVLFLIVLIF